MLAPFTDINILLDDSASMGGSARITKQALDEFVAAQLAVPGQARLTLATFAAAGDFRYVIKDGFLNTYRPDEFKYYPQGGSTALRTSWLRLMRERGVCYSSLPETSRPEKVLFVIITDGLDNASYFGESRAVLNQAVRHQRDVYQWQFIYLGAKHDAVFEATQYGVDERYTMQYSENSVRVASASLSGTVASYRSEGALRSFTVEDRAKAMGKDKAKNA
jgi:hypothetical protein